MELTFILSDRALFQLNFRGFCSGFLHVLAEADLGLIRSFQISGVPMVDTSEISLLLVYCIAPVSIEHVEYGQPLARI